MIRIESMESISELSELKKAYFEHATAPLDGMWHFGFVPVSKHWGFYLKQRLVGFCCINDDGYMLQFYLEPNCQVYAQALFTLIAQQNSSNIKAVKGAFVSTAEPHYMSLCLDNSTTFNVNALMYRAAAQQVNKQNESLTMQLATKEQLSDFVLFAVTNIGAPQEWVSGYYGHLIDRKELLGYWKEGQLLAAGECRLFDEHQTEYADLGVVVSQSERGQGLAKKVLCYLTNIASNKGLNVICSTESHNVAAQKAIGRAGLLPFNRIVQFEFNRI